LKLGPLGTKGVGTNRLGYEMSVSREFHAVGPAWSTPYNVFVRMCVCIPYLVSLLLLVVFCVL